MSWIPGISHLVTIVCTPIFKFGTGACLMMSITSFTVTGIVSAVGTLLHMMIRFFASACSCLGNHIVHASCTL